MRRTSSQHGGLQHPAYAQALWHTEDAGARRRRSSVVAAELEGFTDIGGRRSTGACTCSAWRTSTERRLASWTAEATDDEAQDLPAGGRHQAAAKSAGARRPKTPSRPATRDGRRAIESGTRDLSAETKEILRGGYTLDDKQKEVYDQFTEMLADFDLYMMVNILEDALKDAQKKTMLEDYSVDPAALRR